MRETLRWRLRNVRAYTMYMSLRVARALEDHASGH